MTENELQEGPKKRWSWKFQFSRKIIVTTVTSLVTVVTAITVFFALDDRWGNAADLKVIRDDLGKQEQRSTDQTKLIEQQSLYIRKIDIRLDIKIIQDRISRNDAEIAQIIKMHPVLANLIYNKPILTALSTIQEYSKERLSKLIEENKKYKEAMKANDANLLTIQSTINKITLEGTKTKSRNVYQGNLRDSN